MMKTIGRILCSGIVGTVCMTLYIIRKSRKEYQLYLQPVLMNKMIDREKKLPEIRNKLTNPIGWLLHFGAGVSFVGVYWLIWKNSLKNLSFQKIIIIGIISGIIGVVIWKAMLEEHPRPPANDRFSYFKHLLISHVIFSISAIYSYQLLAKETESR